jgi:pimeloyl-ACP methyl ester carboxylesterase
MLGQLSCRCICVIVLLPLLARAGEVHSARDLEQFKESIASFVFDSPLGNTAPPITVWYYRPDKVEPATRVVFLMHGSSRTGKEARNLGLPFAKTHGFILIAPEFSEKQYPNDSYAFGNMVGPDSKLLPKSVWAFTTIERVFDIVRSEFHLTAETYDIVGHSAGGQLVHRLVLFAPQLRFRRAVASSPGRYALPTPAENFPYGFKGTSLNSGLAKALSRDFVLVLGDRDIVDRERERAAMHQGANRFARGLRFFATAAEEANRLNVQLCWRLQILHGADHSPGPAVQAALEELMR